MNQQDNHQQPNANTIEMLKLARNQVVKAISQENSKPDKETAEDRYGGFAKSFVGRLAAIKQEKERLDQKITKIEQEKQQLEKRRDRLTQIKDKLIALNKEMDEVINGDNV